MASAKASACRRLQAQEISISTPSDNTLRLCRPRPQIYPTSMALRNGLPATGSPTGLFTLVFQRPVQTAFGPADFLISGTFHDAYLRAMPMPGQLRPHRAPIVIVPDPRS